jgi:RND superfamily putative drug exporter
MTDFATYTRRAAAAAARHPRRTIALWLVLVVGCLVVGSLAGTRPLSDTASETGESQQADRRIDSAGLQEPPAENILVRASDAATAKAAVADLTRRVASLRGVRDVTGPKQSPELVRNGGRAQLVQVQLRGSPDNAVDNAAPVERAVAAAARANPSAKFNQAGDGSVDRAFDKIVGDGLTRAELTSVPLTLVILLIAFGALVAASVPLLLAITSVAAALGALGVVSQITPTDDSTATVVVLIGLAVGVDYSLFYIRREREERRAGRSQEAALDIAAGTVGRAVLVSGLTVMVALSGLLISGLAVFESMALATMLVALIAVVASLTVLPAVLALLGERVDRGRVPGLGRRSRGRTLWSRLANVVTRHPRAALVASAGLLAVLAVPAFGMRTASPGISELPHNEPVAKSVRAIERVFPGQPQDAQIVVTGSRLDREQAKLHSLGVHARAITGGRGTIDVRVARDGRTALVAVPMPDRSASKEHAIVSDLRASLESQALRLGPDTQALVTGAAAQNADFSGRLARTTPLVIVFVLALAFLLLLAAFRSAPLAAAVVGLNLLSIGAAYGLLVAVFQHSWAEGLLGFTSSGTITDWLPLFAFVILFGLSMDYTILVLERIREERRLGRSAREAAANGVAATAGAVTSAAIIMVAVFAVFATLGLLQFKQFGFGLAAAILIDATIVRGIALPAVVTLLGEQRWRVPVRRPSRELAVAAR